MNKKQRARNRQTAKELRSGIRYKTPCPECGLPCEGGHWVGTRQCTLEDITTAEKTGKELNPDDFGFWTCAKFYGPDGKRLVEHRVTALNPGRMFDEGMTVLAALLGSKKSHAMRIITPSGPYDDSRIRAMVKDTEEQTRGWVPIWSGTPDAAYEDLDVKYERALQDGAVDLTTDQTHSREETEGLPDRS